MTTHFHIRQRSRLFISLQFAAGGIAVTAILLGLNLAGAADDVPRRDAGGKAQVVPADTPLMISAKQRSPRQLVRDRATVAARLASPAAPTARVPLNRPDATASGAPGFPAKLEQAAVLCDAGRGAEAMALLHEMQSAYAKDVGFLFVQANAYLQGGDAIAARLAFDELLIQRPGLASGYLGRGLAAGRVGSVRRMQADLTLAGVLDPAQAEQFRNDHRKEMDEIAASTPHESAAALSDEIIKSAQAGAEMPALLPIAMKLRRAMNVSRKVPQELYQDGLRIRCAAAESNPGDAQAWADLATYLYNCAGEKYGRDAGDPTEWQNDMLLAMRFVNQAQQLDPRNITAIATKGWLMEQDNQERDALELANIGLSIMPGYPRAAKLQSIVLNVSGIRARNEAARQRAPKTFTTVVPGWIITWRRGPTEEELQKARAFDAMSAGNISQANAVEFQAWQKFGNSLAEMNVAAGYLDYVGRTDEALALWNQIIKLDANDQQALENLQEFYEETHQDDLAFQMRHRLDNRIATSATALVEKANAEINQSNFAEAAKNLAEARETDPANSAVYRSLATLALAEHGEEAWWPYARCSEALEEAVAQLRGVDVRDGATDAVPAYRVQFLLWVWNGELKIADHFGHADLSAHYTGLIDAMRRRARNDAPTSAELAAEAERRHRAIQDIANNDGNAAAQASAAAAWRAVHETAARAESDATGAFVEQMKVLMADDEPAAAARRCLAPGRIGEGGHPDANGPALDAAYPVYLYLRTRAYHYQLWHYFGPNALETYEAYARTHRALDPNSPPSRGYAPAAAK